MELPPTQGRGRVRPSTRRGFLVMRDGPGHTLSHVGATNSQCASRFRRGKKFAAGPGATAVASGQA
jgi:hypothetical protein